MQLNTANGNQGSITVWDLALGTLVEKLTTNAFLTGQSITASAGGVNQTIHLSLNGGLLAYHTYYLTIDWNVFQDPTTTAYSKLLRSGGLPRARGPRALSAGISPELHPDWLVGLRALSPSSRWGPRGARHRLRPAPEFGVSEAEWMKLTPPQRVAWVKANLSALFSNVREMAGWSRSRPIPGTTSPRAPASRLHG